MKIKNRPPQHLADDFLLISSKDLVIKSLFAYKEEKVILNIVIYSLISENSAC
jgi:hypothetical protein